MDKKKVGIIAAVAVAVLAAAGGGAWYFLKGNAGVGNSADKVYVEKVSSLNAANSGVQNRYTGIVEPQETWEVKKEPEREVKEVFVKEGDMVEEGDPLFEYDMDEVAGEIQQAQLELEGMQNEISNLKNQITQLTKERNAAAADDRYEYTADIQEKENEIKQTEYNIESKKAEIQKKQDSVDKAVVNSKIAGVVKSINESETDPSGETVAYMTVLAVGDYRVKGSVTETNVQFLSEEQPVILRSRIDEEQTWSGTISKVDTENKDEGSGNNEMSMDSGSGVEKATKYPFYVTLDSTEGLMMGQHLFIELDEGQTEKKEGIWLFEGYIVMEGQDSAEGADLEGLEGLGEEGTEGSDEEGTEGLDEEGTEGLDEEGTEGSDGEGTEGLDGEGTEGLDGEGLDEEFLEGAEGLGEGEGPGEDNSNVDAYVWADNGKNRLEKRKVELGEYDAELGAYEILSGITEEDSIAFPMEGLYEGVATVTDASEVDYSSPLYNPEGEEGGENSEDESGAMPDGGDMETLPEGDGFSEDGEMLDDGWSDSDFDGSGEESGSDPEGDSGDEEPQVEE